MPKFLNTHGLSEWIARIIDETERELVIISPYLQLSDRIYKKLLDANNRGVETILIYRENNLKEADRMKLYAIDNLNLMHHPNIHAKCIYNENFLLIGSMNLYEYSEINNREMGVLFHKIDLPEFNDVGWGSNHDNDYVFEEALEEILEIKNGAEMQRPSRETVALGFELDILKNKQEKREEFVRMINTVFLHKKFIVAENDGFICKSYLDKVDVTWHYRMEFLMKFEEGILNTRYNIYKSKMKDLEFSIQGFKMYWNQPDCILLYDDIKHHLWNNLNSEIEKLELRKKGIDEMIRFIKQL